jgi:alpha-D-ribose 1-methylphosphonate 5-triphosphate synthase subunit PhnG
MTRATGNGSSAGTETAARQGLMRVCAEATEADLETALAELGGEPAFEELRAPQSGLVMLRGRIGGSGPAFNVGEATVTRAVVKLPTGEIGYSYLLGRSHRRARLAALIDALGQDPAKRGRLEAALVEPVTARRTQERAKVRAETAATRVDFFTLVRGED